MDTSKIIMGGIVGLVVGLILSPVVFRGQSLGQGMMNRASVDRHFIEQMIPHHEGAIEMAKLALERSKRSEILSLSKGIIEAQESEIVKMKQWYKEWFGGVVPAIGGHMMNGEMMGGTMHMNGMSGDLDDLKNAKDFDLEFIRQMIPHHEMAVMMAGMLKGSTDRPEMKKLADDIITSQSREIEMMRGWVEAWGK
jgi:uncharacterized protein (DUF305 family)